ncbi:MAG: trehalose-binding protein [Desulfobacteraceae bacterium]|nr:trehalose-binding protein [Desulfobacteraceae bacterium]
MNIGKYTFSEFSELARSFHGYPAPGLLIGGYMVEAAKAKLPEGTLFEAVVETGKCLPDAVQLLSLCSTGNNWMKVIHLGRYALTLYDKYTCEGWRVCIDPDKLGAFPEIRDWFLKRKTKSEQDTDKLFAEIEAAGDRCLSITPVKVRQRDVKKAEMGEIAICPVCREAYPEKDGSICRGCQGEAPYRHYLENIDSTSEKPDIEAIPLEKAAGKKALHDMTRIVPGKTKGPAFKAGQEIGAGDLCRLQQMGRSYVYVQSGASAPADRWIHENEAVMAFAEKMAGPNVYFPTPPSEGKINFHAKITGLLTIDAAALENFNLVPNVMCTSRQNHILVEKDKPFAGSRAIPLYLDRNHFEHALETIAKPPLFSVLPIKPASVGILVTGTEVYRGLVEDKFEPVIRKKVEYFNCEVVHTAIAADDEALIAESIQTLLDKGADLIITTAGLSVDPDDRTRKGLDRAGLEDVLYGAPILPGAMTLLGRIRGAMVIGVPACALFHKTTSLDLLLPRILAGQHLTRKDMAKYADGGFCLNCKSCTFPKCPFGK